MAVWYPPMSMTIRTNSNSHAGAEAIRSETQAFPITRTRIHVCKMRHIYTAAYPVCFLQGGVCVYMYWKHRSRWLNNHAAQKVSDSASSVATQCLELDEPASTVLTKPSPRWHCRNPIQEWRYLSVREAARLQSFPDSLQLRGNMASQYRQVGNAVPVRLAYALGRTIVAALGGRDAA